MSAGILKSAKSLMKTKLFVVIIVIWVLTALMVSAAMSITVPETTFVSTVNGHLPPYRSAVIFGMNSSTLYVYSQTFDMYGLGIAGAAVTYSLSVYSGGPVVVAPETAGMTNSTGFISYNMTGIYSNQVFLLRQSVDMPGKGYVNTTTAVMDFVPPAGVTATNPIPVDQVLSVTPVIESSDHSDYAMHIWKLPSSGSVHLNAFCQISPTLGYTGGHIPSLLTSYFNYTTPMGSMNLVYEANVPTGLPVHGDTQYYGVVFRSDTGAMWGDYVFGTLVTPAQQADYMLNSAYALMFLIIIVWAIMLPPPLENLGYGIRKSRLKRLAEGASLPEYRNSYEKFRGNLAISVLMSLPLTAVTTASIALAGFLKSGVFPGISEIFGYSAIALLLFAMSASLLILFSRTRPGKFFYKLGKKTRSEHEVTLLLLLATYLLVVYYLALNVTGFMLSLFYSYDALIRTVIISNAVTPFSFPWLAGEYISRNIIAGQTLTFNPAAYGLNLAVVSGIGAFWLFLTVILPLLVLRRRSGSDSMP